MGARLDIWELLSAYVIDTEPILATQNPQDMVGAELAGTTELS